MWIFWFSTQSVVGACSFFFIFKTRTYLFFSLACMAVFWWFSLLADGSDKLIIYCLFGVLFECHILWMKKGCGVDLLEVQMRFLLGWLYWAAELWIPQFYQWHAFCGSSAACISWELYYLLSDLYLDWRKFHTFISFFFFPLSAVTRFFLLNQFCSSRCYPI